jgi:predicted nuclease of predicted toxin-antitoxin system
VIWLLLDRTASPALQSELEALGVRSIHASVEELATADARRLLDAAIEDECLIVTRNYADFTDLASAYRHGGREFPGILFLPENGREPFEQARAISAWLQTGAAESARNKCVWLEL